jgi:hypothetical protein
VKSHAPSPCCDSGALGDSHTNKQISEIAEGMTLLTASTKGQYAAEQNGGGLFTDLLLDALGGAAANLVGEVTPGSVYAHIDQSLGSWSQRPVFKTNVKNLRLTAKGSTAIAAIGFAAHR